MKKITIFALVVVIIISMIATFSLVGCKEEEAIEEETQVEEVPVEEVAEEEEEPVEEIKLTFWNGFTGADGPVLIEVVDRFNEEYAGRININMEIMPWDTLYQKLPLAISTDEAPSFILTGSEIIPSYVESGSLMPLDDFWTVTGINESDINQAALDICKYDGQYYSIPMEQFFMILYWNKDLFEEAGLDPETPPETWDELASYAAQITDRVNEQYGWGQPVKWASQSFTSLIWANGGDIVDLEKKKSVLDSSENIESFKFLQNLATSSSPIGITGPDLDNLINAGNLGMYITGPWMIPGLQENNINFGMARTPKGSADQYSLVDICGFEIPSTTSEEEKLAVYEFIAYWNSHDICKEWSVRNGFPPYLKSVIEDADIQSDPILSVISKFGDITRAYLPGISKAQSITNDVMWPLIESVVFGGNVETEVKNASEKIDTILEE